MILAQTLIALAAAAGIFHLATRRPAFMNAARITALASILALFTWLLLEGRSLHSCPLTDAWGVMAMTGIILIAISGWASFRFHFPGLLIGVLVLLSVAMIFGRLFFPAPGTSEIKLNLILGFHILVTSIGFSVMALGCVSGILILVRSRMLKSASWSTRSNRGWPSLVVLDKLFIGSSELGIILLCIGILLGALTVPGVILKGEWYLDPKVMLTAAGFGIYGWVFALRRKAGFFSWKIVAAATAGYIFVLLAFFLSSILGTGFHRF
jgi:hypothetical protein